MPARGKPAPARALMVAVALAALCACTYTPRPDSSEQGYLNQVRTFAPAARTVSDETLIRIGLLLCGVGQTDGLAAQRRAVVLLYDETRRFDLAELDVLLAAFAPAQAMCRDALQSTSPIPMPPAPDLTDATQEDVDAARGEVVAALRAQIAGAAIDEEPALDAVDRVAVSNGLVTVRVRAADGDDPGAAGCAAAQIVAGFQAQLDTGHPYVAALILGAPVLSLDLAVAGGADELLMRSEAALLDDLATGRVRCDVWADLAERR